MHTRQEYQFTMGPSTLSVVFIVVLGLTATLPEPAMADMKEYLRQLLDVLETRQLEEVGSTTTPTNQLTTTSQMPKDCQEAYTMGLTSSGVYRIAPEPNTPIDVYCEQELSGGGWIVFQVRKDGSVDFYRDWNAYKQGFGEMTGEFWLGNTNLHLLTKGSDQELKVEFTSPEGLVKYADYSHFSIAPEADNFRLSVSGYTGGKLPGDSIDLNNGGSFSTRDRDNDGADKKSWAIRYRGAWWYRSGGGLSNLNGRYGGTRGTGVWWFTWKAGESMKGTRMMLRKKP